MNPQIVAKALPGTTGLLPLERMRIRLRAGQLRGYSCVAGKSKWKLRFRTVSRKRLPESGHYASITKSSRRVDELSSCPYDVSRRRKPAERVPVVGAAGGVCASGSRGTRWACCSNRSVSRRFGRTGSRCCNFSLRSRRRGCLDENKTPASKTKARRRQSGTRNHGIPSVKALTQFPSVLDDMAKNLAWTSALGEASATQQQDVMAAVQRMRAKAYAAGNLKSGPEIKVVQESPQTIVIQPANPQIVYVPAYNPTVVYGAPVVVPGYSSGGHVAAAAVISFGVGIAVESNDQRRLLRMGSWGYWGTNWRGNTIIYNRNIYVGNSYWRGGYYGGGYRPGYPSYRPGSPGYRPGNPGYRPPGYPGYGRPPATTLPAGPGTRPGGGGTPGYGRPPATTLPAGPGTRPGGGGTPSTRPINPGNRPVNTPGTRPGGGGTPSTRPTYTGNRPNQTPATRPSTNPARGYQRPANSPSTQPARPNAFSGSAGGRAQSARGNQSLGASGGARRK